MGTFQTTGDQQQSAFPRFDNQNCLNWNDWGGFGHRAPENEIVVSTTIGRFALRVQLLHPVKKISWGFTSHTAINPTAAGTPKYFEFLREPDFLVSVALKNDRSKDLYDCFVESVKNGNTIYTPVLGWHNCPAELKFISVGEFTNKQFGEFETKGFVVARSKPKITGMFRIGFDKMPTFQNNDFWNLPDKYVNIIYPEYPNSITVEGIYFVYNDGNKTENLCLI